MASGKLKKWLPSLLVVMMGLVLALLFYFVFMKVFLPIPLAYILIGGDAAVVAIGIMGLTIRRYKLWGWEGFVFADARLEGVPVLNIIEVGSNHGDFVLGEKKKEDDIEFHNEKSGVQVDPTMTTGNTEPERHPFGLNIYKFSHDNWLPITTRNELAYKAIIEDREKTAPCLSFLTDIEYITLLSTPVNHLEHDCMNYIMKYQPAAYRYTDEKGTWEVDIDEKFLSDKILRQQDHVAKLPIGRGFLAGNEAFKAIAYAHSSQDLEELKQLWMKQFLEDWLKKVNFLIIGLAALMVLVGAGVAVYIIGMAGK